jgi:hypothetical protein
MSDALLIEEAGDRAIDRLHQLLTLVLLAFEEGEARARSIMLAERIIDPVASACFGEARELLLRPAAGAVQLFAAVMALDVAASREPDCYGAVLQAIRGLVFGALEDVVALELAAAGSEAEGTDPLTPERTCN